MAVKYNGLLRFTDEIKAEIDLAADGAVEKAVIIDGDGVETPIGGGGTSDFTTAEVTISGATGDKATVLLMPRIQVSDIRTGIGVIEVTASRKPKTYNVPLFKGHCFITLKSGDVGGLTGNVTSFGDWLDVTGNCSLIAYYVQN